MKMLIERRGALRCSRSYVEISLFESSEFGIVQDSIASWGEYLDSEDWVKTEKPEVPDLLKQEQVDSLASALQIINIAPSTEPDERVVDGWSTDLTISHGRSTIRLHWSNIAPRAWTGIEALSDAVNRILVDNERERTAQSPTQN